MTGIETLPEGWTEKAFLTFVLKKGGSIGTAAGPVVCFNCQYNAKPYALLRTRCCLTCLLRIGLSYRQALDYLQQLQPGMTETAAHDLLQLTPNMLNPTYKRWRFDRCLFEREAITSIYERYRASDLPVLEFAKTQPPSLLYSSHVQRIDKCCEDGAMRKACQEDLKEGVIMARKMQLMRIFIKRKLPESLRSSLGLLAAEDKIINKVFTKKELEEIAPCLKQRLETIKTREDAVALKKGIEQELLVWYGRELKRTFKKTAPTLHALLGDASKRDNAAKNRLNDEINSICMASVLYELWLYMDAIVKKRNSNAPRIAFNLLEAHKLADEDGKPTTPNGRHYTSQDRFFQLRCDTEYCYGKFMPLSSIQELANHIEEHCPRNVNQLWFVPIIDADSPLLAIKNLDKYYAAGQNGVTGRFLPMGAPATTRPAVLHHRHINPSPNQPDYDRLFMEDLMMRYDEEDFSGGYDYYSDYMSD
ncbi:hypothetical protein BCR37DRAFT_83200 [Protomyces lactucae-debilis]|uniref:Uncharacterized protein n=1 Tax=Protomyces lactucae-debilis TaxID=2754530 RepID=A0A1Y2FAU9_PROLT|nr:uncharacterized protein BCR37DRAFT_83200 [Protomyces lactucae-debilis]ORY79985.1 hypothetical protein BCR37DRAFT_83200 [Protomyces lactucae-debilis]